jgi:hypothetical protein
VFESEQATEGRAQAQSLETSLERISKTADELLSQSRELIGARAPGAEKTTPATLQEKLDSFYGVRQRRGVIEFAALEPRAQQVAVAGDFNGWDPAQTFLARHNGNGRWTAALPLKPGTYRYRYVIDGRWQQDPYNERTEVNPFGEFNSLLEVK